MIKTYTSPMLLWTRQNDVLKPLFNSINYSNLFYSKLIFKWAKIGLLACFLRMAFSSLLKSAFWEIDLYSSTSGFPSPLPSISCQSKICEMTSAKLLHKIEVPDLLRYNLLLLKFLRWKVFVWSFQKHVLFNTKSLNTHLLPQLYHRTCHYALWCWKYLHFGRCSPWHS